jgi:energy-coupling factor transporter ATP-binding protein EcfA2
MALKTIFNKPVDRPIEGVIKADDETSLSREIEEYVLTNIVEKRLESFLDAYNNYEGANGVWVSGFFGSGKSHLLKMLALLLENRQIDGAAALDLFLPKCVDNEILRGDLRRAVAIPSKSILFNIDQKADVISKTQIDALLAVFVKVFDEMCGYYGKQGHIALFERDLDSRGLYGQFKSAYESIAGRTWRKGREQALLEAKSIVVKDPSIPNRAIAAEILINKLNYDDALLVLREALKTEDLPLQLQVAISIRNIGEKAEPLIPLIQDEIYPKISGEVWGRYKNWFYPMFIGMALDQILINCGVDLEIVN